jgi:hypothetical protein
MPLYRFYIDKAKGAEHSRVFDVHAVDEEQARGKLKLGKGESENSVVTLHEGGTAPPLSGELLVDFYKARLEELGVAVQIQELKL